MLESITSRIAILRWLDVVIAVAQAANDITCSTVSQRHNVCRVQTALADYKVALQYCSSSAQTAIMVVCNI